MVYVTGDTHADFRRFERKILDKKPYQFTENDLVIICGDFGLLWEESMEFEYSLKWLSGLPFTILWVQGNHENYNMIAEFPIEEWNGGKVRHIARDKIILLERGQIFNIQGDTYFTFGGASSHDVDGGILDKNSATYPEDYRAAVRSRKPFRVLNESWWPQELPTDDEINEARKNLEQVNYQVDYVITHCSSNYMQSFFEKYWGFPKDWYKSDVLTGFFDELENKLQYKHWYFGHYHQDESIDDKHSLLYCAIVPVEYYKEGSL